MPSLSQKKRENDSTVLEQDTLNNMTAGKTLPSEYIPAINMANFIDPDTSTGDANKTGFYGGLTQTGVDNIFGGVGKLKPAMIYGNSAQAGSINGVTQITVVNQGSGYTTIPSVAISGDGTGAVATANISAGAVTSVSVANSGQDYTNANVTISGGGGNGASATASIGSGKISDSLIYSEPGGRLSKLDTNGTYIGALKAGVKNNAINTQFPAIYPNPDFTLVAETDEIVIPYSQVYFEVKAYHTIETQTLATQNLGWGQDSKITLSVFPYTSEEVLNYGSEYCLILAGNSGRFNIQLSSLDTVGRSTVVSNKFKIRVYSKVLVFLTTQAVFTRGGQIIWKAYPALES